MPTIGDLVEKQVHGFAGPRTHLRKKAPADSGGLEAVLAEVPFRGGSDGRIVLHWDGSPTRWPTCHGIQFPVYPLDGGDVYQLIWMVTFIYLDGGEPAVCQVATTAQPPKFWLGERSSWGEGILVRVFSWFNKRASQPIQRCDRHVRNYSRDAPRTLARLATNDPGEGGVFSWVLLHSDCLLIRRE